MANERKRTAGGATPEAGVPGPPRAPGRQAGPAELDEEALLDIERRHPSGLSASQIVELVIAAGGHLSEATFRKWVQLGLLPRSRRVGRKGKHQGSLGLYPAQAVRQVVAIRRQMAAGLTVEDIVRSHRLRDGVEALGRALRDLLGDFHKQLGAQAALGEGERRQAEKQLEQLGKQGDDLFRRLGILERRIVAPLEREARARAFGSGTSGGAGDLL